MCRSHLNSAPARCSYATRVAVFPYHISDASVVVVQIFFGIGAILGQFEHPQKRLWTDVRSTDPPHLALHTMPTLPVPACRTLPAFETAIKTYARRQ